MMKRIIPIMPYRFSNDVFLTKEMSHFAHLKFNKRFQKIGYQDFNLHCADKSDKLDIACIFEI